MFLFSYACLDPKGRECPHILSLWQRGVREGVSTPSYSWLPPPPWEEVGLPDLMVIRPHSLLSGPGMLRATALMMAVLCSHGTGLFLWSLWVSTASSACPCQGCQVSTLPLILDWVGTCILLLAINRNFIPQDPGW